LLAKRNNTDGKFEWKIHQGVELGRPSLLHASAEMVDGEVIQTKVGGSVVMVGEGTIRVPSHHKRFRNVAD